MAQYFCKWSRSRFRLKKFESEPGSIIFDWMILSRIFVFLDHGQQPLIVYELSWLNFDNVRLYHAHYVPYYLWRKSRNTESIPFEPESGSFAEVLGQWYCCVVESGDKNSSDSCLSLLNLNLIRFFITHLRLVMKNLIGYSFSNIWLSTHLINSYHPPKPHSNSPLSVKIFSLERKSKIKSR